jgi:septal ring factor EnvC (AmiA/AmiB activator)
MVWKTTEKRMKQKHKTVKGHSSRLEQVEHRISKLEDKIEIKEKNEELLVKQLKTYKRTPNLRIMGIEEEVQAKGIRNTFNKIITENFPNLEKVMPIQVQETSRTPNRLDQNRTTP